MVLAGFEGLDEETVGSKEVMLASLGLLVHLDLGVEVLVECGDGCLQGWWGFNNCDCIVKRSICKNNFFTFNFF